MAPGECTRNLRNMGETLPEGGGSRGSAARTRLKSKRIKASPSKSNHRIIERLRGRCGWERIAGRGDWSPLEAIGHSPKPEARGRRVGARGLRQPGIAKSTQTWLKAGY